METVVYILLGLTLVFGVMAIMLHSMTKSAIALAVASATLGLIMYLLGSTWAALFEVSVCSGLVTVIFISAISLSNVEKKDLEKVYEDKKRKRFLPAALIISGVALVAIAIAAKISLPAAVTAAKEVDNMREILWNSRQVDIWGQIIVILTGSVAVVVLFRERD